MILNLGYFIGEYLFFLMFIKFFRSLFGKKTVADIGYQVPSNLKFGIVVAIALFWADFLRTLIQSGMIYFGVESSPLLANLILAIIATLVGIAVLEGYKKIVKVFTRIEVD